jgi:UPF0755 protein
MINKLLTALFFLLLFVLVSVVLLIRFFGPPGNSNQIEVFVVPQQEYYDVTVQSLMDQKYIKNAKAFSFLLNNFSKAAEIKPGGYNLRRNMNAWQVMKKITGNTDLVWVTISFCPRKEQVGEKLAVALNWDENQLTAWNNLYKNDKPEYFEGVYYPDTYLIPVDASPAQVAQRFINHFNEKIAPLADEFTSKNIKWTTGLKIASLIAREAAGPSDMNLISGIIWNRLNQGIRLQIDATMQYTLGKNADGSWWGPVSLDEKKSDSPYNSYLHEGLPPTPICSPNIDAITAALNPENTDCLYYLHDSAKEIHCAVTYAEHLANIKTYLK